MDAEDAVQETFTRYFCLRGSLDSEEHIKAWLIVTASNYCKDMLKQWWRKRRSMEDIGEMAGAEAQKDNEMIDLVRKLPDKYKTAVYLYYYEGYSSKEIAKILKKPPSTIRTYLQKARRMLKQEFQ